MKPTSKYPEQSFRRREVGTGKEECIMKAKIACGVWNIALDTSQLDHSEILTKVVYESPNETFERP